MVSTVDSTHYTCVKLKGIGQYFEIFFLAEFHLSCKMGLLIYEDKKKTKFVLEIKKSSIFVKHA